MPRNKQVIPDYGTVTQKGIIYYRTRITDADGKRVALYAHTPEELYKKVKKTKKAVEDARFHNAYPTVAEYSQKWLHMKSAVIRPNTLKRYEASVRNYIIKPIGNYYMAEVTADDLKLLMVPLAQKSVGFINEVTMLIKNIFLSAFQSKVIKYNPAAALSAKGGVPAAKKEPLTDAQVKILLDAVRGLSVYPFVLLGLFAGLRREEILALQWDCVILDEDVPYISIRRAWRVENKIPVIDSVLKTPSAQRDIPIPKILTACLTEVKENSCSDFVIANKDGGPLTGSQFNSMWGCVTTRSTKERVYYRYVNGVAIRYPVQPRLGGHPKCNPNITYSMDFSVTPHQLRHTYITNLIHAGVDPKTVQYLAGHKNSRTTMDIYAKVKYNRPEELYPVVNKALS